MKNSKDPKGNGCKQNIDGANEFIDGVNDKIEKRGLKQKFVADSIQVHEVSLSRVLKKKEPLSEAMKEKLTHFFDKK